MSTNFVQFFLKSHIAGHQSHFLNKRIKMQISTTKFEQYFNPTEGGGGFHPYLGFFTCKKFIYWYFHYSFLENSWHFVGYHNIK